MPASNMASSSSSAPESGQGNMHICNVYTYRYIYIYNIYCIYRHTLQLYIGIYIVYIYISHIYI